MKRFNDQDAQDYLPKIETSMRVRETKKVGNKETVVWSSWERFQGRIHNGNKLINSLSKYFYFPFFLQKLKTQILPDDGMEIIIRFVNLSSFLN